MDEMWSDMEEPVREVEAPPSPEQVAPRPTRYRQSVMFEEELGGVNTEGQRAQRSSRDRDSGRAGAIASDIAMGDGRRSDGGDGDEATAKSVDTEDSRATDEPADADAGTGGGRRKRRYRPLIDRPLIDRPLIDRAGELAEARARDGAAAAAASGVYLAPSVLADEIIADDMGATDDDAVADDVTLARGDDAYGDDAADEIGLEGEGALPVAEAAPASEERPRRGEPRARQQRQVEQRRETKAMRTGAYSDGLPPIKVVGVGGGGCNAVSRMIAEHIPGVQFVAVNTDAQALAQSPADVKIRIGDKLTKGLGVGGDPGRGLRAAEESEDDLLEAIRGSEMVFVTAGMGGGTGTGASPIVARVAKDAGALTIGVVTKPFSFEGTKRWTKAEEGIQRLQDEVDTLIVIPNDRLLQVCDEKVTYEEAFRTADDVLLQGIRGISEIITLPGEINLDFADVRNVMSEAGQALMSIGTGTGPTRAEDAARMAIESPMLEVAIHGARAVLYNIVGGKNLGLHEINAAAEVIQSVVDPDAEIFFGTAIDPEMGDEVRITLIATGFATLRSLDRIPDEYRKAVGDDVVSIHEPAAMERMEADADAQPNNRELPAFLRRRITAR